MLFRCLPEKRVQNVPIWVVTTKHQPDKGPGDLIPFGLIEPRTLVEHGLFLGKSFEQSDIPRIRFK
jgi:hypothetical protein